MEDAGVNVIELPDEQPPERRQRSSSMQAFIEPLPHEPERRQRASSLQPFIEIVQGRHASNMPTIDEQRHDEPEREQRPAPIYHIGEQRRTGPARGNRVHYMEPRVHIARRQPDDVQGQGGGPLERVDENDQHQIIPAPFLALRRQEPQLGFHLDVPEQFDVYEDTNAGMDLDVILLRIKTFGYWRLITYIFLCLPVMFNAFQSTSINPVLGPVHYSCNRTHCGHSGNGFKKPNLETKPPIAEPIDMECNRSSRHPAMASNCKPKHVEKTKPDNCLEGYKFLDADYAEVNESGMFCSNKRILEKGRSLNIIGMFLGLLWSGIMSDTWGRQSTMFIAGLASTFIGIIRWIPKSELWFLTFETLQKITTCMIFPTAFLIAIELVVPQERVMAGTIILLAHFLGEKLLGIYVDNFNNWKPLIWYFYVPSLSQVWFITKVPESVRWLLSQGREMEASVILKEAENFSPSSLRHLRSANSERLTYVNEGTYPIWLTSKIFYLRFLNFSLLWFTQYLGSNLKFNFVSENINISDSFLHGDVFQNLANILPLFIIRPQIGRRPFLLSTIVMSGVCICIIAADIIDQPSKIILAAIVKFAINCNYLVLYLFTAEMFPTSVRNTFLSMCLLSGYALYLMSEQWADWNNSLFIGCTVLNTIIVWCFLETEGKILPTTIDDATNMKDFSRVAPYEVSFDGH